MTTLNNNYWYGSQARMINGTDGEIFPPALQAGETRTIFVGQACRWVVFPPVLVLELQSAFVRFSSIELEHFAYSTDDGMHVYVYRPGKSMHDPMLQKEMGFCNPDTPVFFNNTSVQQRKISFSLDEIAYNSLNV
jgi:hypothetical protein